MTVIVNFQHSSPANLDLDLFSDYIGMHPYQVLAGLEMEGDDGLINYVYEQYVEFTGNYDTVTNIITREAIGSC